MMRMSAPDEQSIRTAPAPLLVRRTGSRGSAFQPNRGPDGRYRRSSRHVGARLLRGRWRDDAGAQVALSSASSAGRVSLEALRQ
jgi:hypothetical protein